MAQLSLVFQDVYLFDDTLEANVRVGRPDASAAEVEEAARLSGVDEIVARHGLEKLKTIGDAYMASVGVPVSSRRHPFDACLAAMAICSDGCAIS